MTFAHFAVIRCTQRRYHFMPGDGRLLCLAQISINFLHSYLGFRTLNDDLLGNAALFNLPRTLRRPALHVSITPTD